MSSPIPADTGSVDQWRVVRHWLNQNRYELGTLAADFYPQATHVGETGLLCRDEWIPSEPLKIQHLKLNWKIPAPLQAVDGTEETSKHVRPVRVHGDRYLSYADALAALDPPSVFENRPCYRILGANLTDQSNHIDFTQGWYFGGVNIGEALAHELAADRLFGSTKAPIHERLALRCSVGDPCDLMRRSVIPAITTLTLRRDRIGQVSFLLHWRDPAKVTHAGGLYQVMPSGIFQPVDSTPNAEQSDLDIWRCMVREFSEELLGTSEDYSNLGTPIDYNRWPFYRQLTEAREARGLDVFCVGLGVDPLTMVADILTIAVFDSDVFDSTFEHMVTDNAEGRVIGEQDAIGVPFNEETITKFINGTEPVQPAGAALLQLAWQYRTQLLV